MKRYLADTTVLVDHLRGKPLATKLLARENIIISVVAMAELIQGARDRKEQKLVEDLIEQFEVNYGSGQVNRLAVKLVSQYFLKYNLRFLDALVAATCLLGDYNLVTDDAKHFKFIENLQVFSLKEVVG